MLPTLTLGDWGSWASIVSLPISLWTLGVSVYVAARVRDVRRRIVFNVRAEELLNEIETARAWIFEALSGQALDERHLESMARQCVAQIHSLRSVVSPDASKISDRLRALERRYQRAKVIKDTEMRRSRQHDILWEIYDDISIFLSHTRNMIADQRLGGSHDLQ